MPTVLIVEDNRALADAVAEVLRSIGYGTLIAHDGEAALSEVERSEPDVAIVDLELPAIDGLEVARRLREGYGKRIRLIANTAWPDNAEPIPKRQTLASTTCSSSPHRSTRFSRQFSTVAAHRIDNRVEALTGYPVGGNAWVSFGHYLPSRTLHSRSEIA